MEINNQNRRQEHDGSSCSYLGIFTSHMFSRVAAHGVSHPPLVKAQPQCVRVTCHLCPWLVTCPPPNLSPTPGRKGEFCAKMWSCRYLPYTLEMTKMCKINEIQCRLVLGWKCKFVSPEMDLKRESKTKQETVQFYFQPFTTQSFCWLPVFGV